MLSLISYRAGKIRVHLLPLKGSPASFFEETTLSLSGSSNFSGLHYCLEHPLAIAPSIERNFSHLQPRFLFLRKQPSGSCRWRTEQLRWEM